MQKNSLEGKTIVITGVTSGMGRALAVIFVKKYGATVIGVGRNEEKCKALQAELPKGAFSYRLFDVGVKEAWQTFADELKSNGTPCDVLINNAGMLPRFLRFNDFSCELAEEVMRTNYLSVVYACHALLPLLEQSKGALFNISSSAALCPLPGATLYEGSKAAVKNFTESLAAEYFEKTLHVGVIFPGFTLTDLFRAQSEEGKRDKRLYRIATPCDKMVKKIEKAVVKRKKRCVFGLDAKGMALLYTLFPKSAGKICGKVLRLFKAAMFEEVWEK